MRHGGVRVTGPDSVVAKVPPGVRSVGIPMVFAPAT
jgi:hypothetical protein